MHIGKKLYFAYGSNMNLEQMAFRCPGAQVVDTVRLEGYRLAFRTNGGGRGVATILPDPQSHVDGVLWRISAQDERNLDYYEGWPRLYGKEPFRVTRTNGRSVEVMAYTMNAPYKDSPACPPPGYLVGILEGCLQNHIDNAPILEAFHRTRQEVEQAIPHERPKNKNREKGR